MQVEDYTDRRIDKKLERKACPACVAELPHGVFYQLKLGDNKAKYPCHQLLEEKDNLRFPYLVPWNKNYQ
jgi:hypothetical protein